MARRLRRPCGTEGRSAPGSSVGPSLCRRARAAGGTQESIQTAEDAQNIVNYYQARRRRCLRSNTGHHGCPQWGCERDISRGACPCFHSHLGGPLPKYTLSTIRPPGTLHRPFGTLRSIFKGQGSPES